MPNKPLRPFPGPWLPAPGPRLLVAGIGNIFLGDDGFGVAVAGRLAAENLPSQVVVRDFGIRGLHLAYEMLDGGFDTTVLVDSVRRGGAPGTVYLIEPDLDKTETLASAPDAHAMTPAAVLAMLQTLGGAPGRVLIVGCEPDSVEERMGLSLPVGAAVDEAVRCVREIVARECSQGA
jgi:hydrogenase maturation protease